MEHKQGEKTRILYSRTATQRGSKTHTRCIKMITHAHKTQHYRNTNPQTPPEFQTTQTLHAHIPPAVLGDMGNMAPYDKRPHDNTDTQRIITARKSIIKKDIVTPILYYRPLFFTLLFHHLFFLLSMHTNIILESKVAENIWTFFFYNMAILFLFSSVHIPFPHIAIRFH